MCVCERVHARMMLVHSNIHRESIAQVKGATKIMVTVVATKELKAGNLLRRFKAEAAQYDPRRGNDNDAACVWKLFRHAWDLLTLFYFLFFPTKAWHNTLISAPIPTPHFLPYENKCTPDPIGSVLAAFSG